MNSVIDLLRHGETQRKDVYCGRTDVLLNSEGWLRLQSATNGQYWNEIVSSPLARCREFAEQLAHSLQIPLHIDARWQEIDFGVWENRSAEELLQDDAERFTKFCQDPEQHGPPDGETLMALQTRVLAAWHELTQAQKSILVITHGGPIRIVHCRYYNYPLTRVREIPVAYASQHRFIISHSPESASSQ